MVAGRRYYTLAMGAMVVLFAVAASRAPDARPSAERAASREYAQRALRTLRFTDAALAAPLGGRPCELVPFLAYRRNVGSSLSDAWYNASQVLADVEATRAGLVDRTCQIVKGLAFLDRVAYPDSTSGYYPRANIDGTGVTTRDSFADDNALIGLSLLEARTIRADEQWRAGLLRRAGGAASFLIESGLWDETYDGGFWWNTNLGRQPEGKPGQTTALAGLFFARLYEETGSPEHAAWARACLAWLDSRLLDPDSGLYRFSVRRWDVADAGSEYLDPRLFSYDQAIVLELLLVFDRALEPGGGYLQRARALADRVHERFWDRERGGYRLEASHHEVYTAYAAWISQSLVELHTVDPDPRWLARARANLDALHAHLRDPADGGYFHMEFLCQDRETIGCEEGEWWSFDPTKLLFSQAWMQRAEAMLAARLAMMDY